MGCWIAKGICPNPDWVKCPDAGSPLSTDTVEVYAKLMNAAPDQYANKIGQEVLANCLEKECTFQLGAQRIWFQEGGAADKGKLMFECPDDKICVKAVEKLDTPSKDGEVLRTLECMRPVNPEDAPAIKLQMTENQMENVDSFYQSSCPVKIHQPGEPQPTEGAGAEPGEVVPEKPGAAAGPDIKSPEADAGGGEKPGGGAKQGSMGELGLVLAALLGGGSSSGGTVFGAGQSSQKKRLRRGSDRSDVGDTFL